MLAAKIVAFTVVVLVIGEIVCFCLVLRRLRDPEQQGAVSTRRSRASLRAVVGTGLYLAVLGLFAMAIAGAHPAHRGGDHRGDRRSCWCWRRWRS